MTTSMTRRHAVLAVGALITRAIGGATPSPNLTIPLEQFQHIRVTWGGEEVFISGREVFDALKGTTYKREVRWRGGSVPNGGHEI